MTIRKFQNKKTVTVDNAGYEEAFEDVNRPNVESASEVVKNLQKKLTTLNLYRGFRHKSLASSCYYDS